MSDPFADLFPRRRPRESEQQRERLRRDVFVEHARRVLLSRWGTALANRSAALPGGQAREFSLVSGNGRIVGEVVWLDGIDPEARAATLSEHVWVVSHVSADRRFVLLAHEPDLVGPWLGRHRGMFDGVEIWSIDGDQLERLA